MSWLARSFANSLRLDDDDDDDYCAENDVASDSHHDPSPSSTRNEEDKHIQSSTQRTSEAEEQEEEEEAQTRGVKEDLTELKQTLTRQLWGVASFLAPPAPPPLPPPLANNRSFSNLNNQLEPSDRFEEGEASDSEELSRIKQDFVEIGGRFRSEISKMASNYFPFRSEKIENDSAEDEKEELETEDCDDFDWAAAGAIGITDEVLAFARNIAMHPETWLDFPLEEEEDLDDFVMSDAQREHTLAIEQLAPRLAALRIELCPCHMSESYFWKVYFVLLHSRLNKHDAEILSTPQVMEARALWMQELHKKTKPENDWYKRSTIYENDRGNVWHEDSKYVRTYDFELTTSRAADDEAEKHSVASTDMQFTDKSVIEEKLVLKHEDKSLLGGRSSEVPLPNYEDDEDDWPDEEDSDFGSYKATIPVGNEEDISFSDLEDDANSTMPIKSKILSKRAETSSKS